MIRIIVLAIVLSFAFLGTASAGDLYMPTGVSEHLDVAQMGMGGLTTVIGTNAHTLFYNPALLNRQSFALDIPLVGIGINTSTMDVVNFIDDHQDDFDNFENLSNEEQEQFLRDSQAFDNKWVGVQATPYVGFATQGLAFGSYGVANGNVKIDQGVMVPAIGLRGFADIVIGIGIGKKLNFFGTSVEMGLTARYVQRRHFAPLRISAQDVNDAEDILDTTLDELKKFPYKMFHYGHSR